MLDIHANEDMRLAYQAGQEDALRFRADPYRDLYQDVFKAETADYKLWIGYDDVDGETRLHVDFKSCAFRDWPSTRHHVEMAYGSTAEAMERAMRFIRQHPAPRPVCWVDY